MAHGFWLAYRAKREPYRSDIVHDLTPEEVAARERVRRELPNGGSRLRSSRSLTSCNMQLKLELPLKDDVEVPTSKPAPVLNKPIRARAHAGDQISTAARKVKPTPPKARLADNQIATTHKVVTKTSSRENATNKAIIAPQKDQVADQELMVEELFLVAVLAPKGTRFKGGALLNALRKQGLKYGEMNIFHRLDPATKAKNFRVANVVDPCTFDLSDLEALASPGILFFFATTRT